ncbi:hypothetical protein [Bacillus paranthracis]|uniref:hypothetical protein n=1 Tax=Bacillus paranthracis TaxID=2026186 RepID=UPI0021D26459|nr:hypothetical protein [Bacillus paranthracis]MCU5201293.1 hypothetical protein [Bacillus paranthracis]
MFDDLKDKMNHKVNHLKKLDISWLLLILTIVSPLIGYFLVKKYGIKFDDIGTYGDFLGGSTIPFLTLFTMVFIYRTYKLQQDQLKTQQSELSLLKKEMESTKETLQEQSKTARMQRFENSFFIQINELRKSKVEAVGYLKTTFGDTYEFNEWMEYIRTNIDNAMSEHIKDSFKSLPKENEKEEYFSAYGKLLTNAFDNSGLFDNKGSFSFFRSVERIMRLIYEYRNIMDDWELDFYLQYLYDEIGREPINIVLYDICINKHMIPYAKVLEFDKFADKFYFGARRHDFYFISYVLYENPDLKLI